MTSELVTALGDGLKVVNECALDLGIKNGSIDRDKFLLGITDALELFLETVNILKKNENLQWKCTSTIQSLK